VESAIATTKQPRFQSLFVEATGPFLADYSLILQGPVGRTMDLAREAHESYKPLTAAMIDPHVRTPEITLAIVRHTGRDIPAVKHVVIMPPGATSRDQAIQPLPRRRLTLRDGPVRDAIPRTWRPSFGSETALFPQFERFAINALPPGEFQIMLVTESGDRRYTVRSKDRARLR
jgi:hypothetical protein